MEKLTLAPSYSWLTYDAFGEQASAFGCGLVALAGMKPHDRLVIYADTRAEWQARRCAPRVHMPHTHSTARRFSRTTGHTHAFLRIPTHLHMHAARSLRRARSARTRWL